MSALHFGKEDLEIYLDKKYKINLFIFFLKGSLIILLPLFFNFEQTNLIFNTILFSKDYVLLSNNYIKFILILNLLMQSLFYLYFYLKKKLNRNDFSPIIFEILSGFLDIFNFLTLHALCSLWYSHRWFRVDWINFLHLLVYDFFDVKDLWNVYVFPDLRIVLFIEHVCSIIFNFWMRILTVKTLLNFNFFVLKLAMIRREKLEFKRICLLSLVLKFDKFRWFTGSVQVQISHNRSLLLKVWLP